MVSNILRALNFSSLLFPAPTAICSRWAAKDDKFCRIALRARSLLATHLTCLISEKDLSFSSRVDATCFSSRCRLGEYRYILKYPCLAVV